MHIALDAMGGDRGSEELVLGAIEAVNDSKLVVSLIGDKKNLESILARHHFNDPERVRVVHTTQVVGMGDSPIDAIRRKPDSSIVVAFDLLRQGKVDSVVSAGNSGATMAAAVRSLGRLPKISRPGIASAFPTLKAPVIMMDVGANVDCRPKHLLQFGVMAAAFSEVIFGVIRPRIGVLSIGEEQGKGNSLVRKTDELFRQTSLNYIGNIEGGDTFLGDVDVIVCDGFVGNVCLKISEGLAEALTGMLRDEIQKSFTAKVGYLLSRNAFSRFKKRIDYAEYGGAPLLGLNGTGIVCHGRSNATAIKNAVFVAAGLIENGLNRRIMELMAEIDLPADSGLESIESSVDRDLSVLSQQSVAESSRE
ncbi:MAG: phosphate acyltransferase PlsX [Proteobacteria bacterium]|nr:phosphate acyltransferase PlsX [Pseudomonadota bacterium]MBU1688921.1 phosphate acyltransferase PlsX [Pseudomonadota bacterium]